MCLHHSYQGQDKGGETRKRGPQGDPAKKKEVDKTGEPEEERPKKAGVVLEERRGLPMPTAGQHSEPVSNHGPEGG